MRITVDVDESDLKDIQAATGVKKKSPAIGRALAIYLRETKKQKVLRMVREGKTDYSTSNEALEKGARYDSG